MAQIDDEDAHCSYAGPGRGDCDHFVGLPGESIPGQHDGPDDTIDVYGKPNGWCWFCWHGLQIHRLRSRLSDLLKMIEAYDMEAELDAGEEGNGPVAQARTELAG